jgi:CubicO group peptidase (beta-lactamase class C family)
MLAPVLLVLALCVGPGSGPAARDGALSESAARAVDEAVRAEMDRQGLVGVAVGVVRDGEIAYLKGYGLADREAGRPVATDTLFRWASISKPLTAVVALRLAEDGKLDLDADVRDYVPEFPDKGHPITARQLLGHLGGIPHYGSTVVRTRRVYDVEHPFADVVLALDYFAESPLARPPGERFLYSTHGYVLLSAVAQRAGGTPFFEQVRERVIGPLGLTTLRPDYQWEAIPGRAIGYRKRGREVVRSHDADVSWKLGGGGFLSGVGDLARFAQALLNHELVSGPTEEVMWTSLRDGDGKPTGYGLGFFVLRDPLGRLVVWHDGATEKARTRMVLFPSERFGVVVMSNCEWAEPQRISQAIYRALHDRPPRPRRAAEAPGP